MEGMLNEYDYATLPSSPKTVRWLNTAQWYRNRLVREGAMRDDSPYGIWGISEKGRMASGTGGLICIGGGSA